MQDSPMMIHYVADPAASTRFYADALGVPVIYDSANFAMLALGPGMRLGLWRADEVAPVAGGQPGAGEVCVALPDAAALTALHDRLAAEGARVTQAPTEMGFGLAFTVLDPDGHRLRPYVPAVR
ncbi:MAG: VOC family protein [Rhodobacter sp.]|nr:VOC family protein [Paracoccaceae bacterium]MCC0077859.1 VOC family protein [Rhodobacter sp.]